MSKPSSAPSPDTSFGAIQVNKAALEILQEVPDHIAAGILLFSLPTLLFGEQCRDNSSLFSRSHRIGALTILTAVSVAFLVSVVSRYHL